VTKLNRNFWIILLLPKEKKKKPFEKSYIFHTLAYTHTYYTFTTLYDYVYVPYTYVPDKTCGGCSYPGNRYGDLWSQGSTVFSGCTRTWLFYTQGGGNVEVVGKKVTMAKIGWRWRWINGKVRVDTEEGIRIIKLYVCKCRRGVKRIQRISILLLYTCFANGKIPSKVFELINPRTFRWNYVLLYS